MAKGQERSYQRKNYDVIDTLSGPAFFPRLILLKNGYATLVEMTAVAATSSFSIDVET